MKPGTRWTGPLLAAGTLLILLAAGELTVRAIFGDRFAQREAFHVADAIHGWRPASSLDDTYYGSDFAIRVRTSARGNRLGHLGEPPPGSRVVLLAGDSHSFGWGVSTEETFASRLEERLDRELGVRLVNLGAGGYGTLQAVSRVEEYLVSPRDTEVVAILLQHTANDATDNLRNFGYPMGLWSVEDRPRRTSRFHLRNWLSYLGRASRSRRMAAHHNASDDPLGDVSTDVLWGFERVGDRPLPPIANIGTRTVHFDEIEPWELDASGAANHGRLGDVQAMLIEIAVDHAREIAAEFDVSIGHLFAPTSPQWFVDAVTQRIISTQLPDSKIAGSTSRIFGDDVVAGFRGTIENAHSGGHYTPEFNAHWAGVIGDQMLDWAATW